MRLKTIVLALGLAVSIHAKCQRSDAGPVLQAALDIGCAIYWAGHEVRTAGRAIKKLALRAYRGLD